MSNTSATGGFLAPASSPAPLEDDALEDFLQEVIVGVTGLSDKVVLPYWQPEPSNQLPGEEAWISFRIANQEPDTYGYVRHAAPDSGSDGLQRHETLEVMLSSYGPNCRKNLSLFRDGLLIEQNRAQLSAAGFGLRDTGAMISAPSLSKDRWVKRVDMPWNFRRIILRTYPVLNLLSAQAVLTAVAELDTGKIQSTINVTGP